MDDPFRVVEREWSADADAFALESFVPTFDLAVGLGVVRRRSHMGHACDANEFLEILGDELWSVVGDDAWSDAWKKFASSLEDDFDLGFLHCFADIVMNDESAATIEDAAHEVESSGDIEVTNIDMPMLVRFERLNEPSAFLGGLRRLSVEQAGGFENAVGAGGTASDDVAIDHHEGESAISFGGILASEEPDAFLFIVCEPMIARDPGVVFVDFSEAIFPIVEFAVTDADPWEEV